MDKTNKILISISAGLVVVIILLIVLSMNIKPSKYTITFDSTGGSTVLDQSVKKNNKVLKPKDPTKKGYMFIEWQYNDKPFDFNTSITKDLTLKALWKEVKEDTEMFTIEFDSTGGSLISKQIIEKGEKVTKPKNPTKKDYNFIEWQYNNEPYDFEKEVEENMVLIAKWEKIEKEPEKPQETSNNKPKENNTPTEDNKNEYTVSFNTNGGSEISNQTIKENDTITRPNNPTRTGYSFDDWLLDGTSYDFSAPVSTNITLNASWIPNKYMISYHVNADNGEGDMEITTCQYDKECILNSNNYSREGYTFAGWSTNPSGEVMYSNGATVSNLTSNNNETIVLYAIWNLNE